MKKIKLEIGGMTCDHCATSIQKKLSKLEGLQNSEVRYPEGHAVISFDEHKLDKQTIIETVNRTGNYRVTGETERGGNGRQRYTLVIIGGGSAAFAAALRTSELGGTALIINKGLPTGGTCVNVGCIPSKTLVRAAESVHYAAHPRFNGIKSDGKVTNFKALIDQKRELVGDLRRQKYLDVIKDDPAIDLLEAYGTVIDRHTVEAGGKRYQTDSILLATGASAFIPDIAGLKETGYLTNESAYELDELPEKLVVLGGGYIALENAQLFSRLGSEVTIIQRSAHILSDQPKEIVDELTHHLEEEGLKIYTHTTIQKVRGDTGRKTVLFNVDGNETSVEATQILVATGRQGNTVGLGLENTGIRTEGRGYIPVDERLETSVPGIYAAGDVTGRYQFVYTAAYEGKLAAENAVNGSKRHTDYSVLPWVIFTDPQVAGVGPDEQQAREAGIEADTATLSLEDVPRSLAARDTRGFINLIRNRANDQLVGARIVAPEGSELLMELSLAIRHGMTVKSLASEFHPYLTLSEGVKMAALTFEKDVKKLSCCAV